MKNVNHYFEFIKLVWRKLLKINQMHSFAAWWGYVLLQIGAPLIKLGFIKSQNSTKILNKSICYLVGTMFALLI
jgi:hypothetical protein